MRHSINFDVTFFFLPISVPGLSTASNPIEALKTVYYLGILDFRIAL